MRVLRVLVACESSGRVRDAFRACGHDAWSCDLLPSPDPTYHIQRDVLEVLGLGWDLMIAHPPCTDLARSGALHFARKRASGEQQRSIEFFMRLAEARIRFKAIENPVGIMSTLYRKPDQLVHPYQFGHDASKQTCFWLTGLPLLRHTLYVPGRLVCCGNKLGKEGSAVVCPTCKGAKKPLKRWANQCDSGQNKLGPSADRWQVRSETYLGIANAMAEQWGNAAALAMQSAA